MTNYFSTIGIFATHSNLKFQDTLEHLVQYLQKKNITIILEEKSNKHFTNKVKYQNIQVQPANTIGSSCDLIIVIGGDGSILHTGREIVDSNTPIVGINRGRVGFLTDINPLELEKSFDLILSGNYQTDDRFLLKIDTIKNGKTIKTNYALNEVVLFNGDMARLIDFEIYIDQQFVVYQRSDGLIATTPTGSTAYALSGGGPIIYPTLNTIALIPMCPHTLSSRPIVINNQSIIDLVIPSKERLAPKLSCDGQVHDDLSPDCQIRIQQHTQKLHLLHPPGYNYFAMLREKLGWHTNPGSNR